MGCGASKSQKPAADEGDAMNKQAEAYLADEQAEYLKTAKVLFLGAGESGKSTVIKSVRASHSNGMSEEDKNEHVEHIHSNTIQGMQAVIKRMEQIDLPTTEQQQSLIATVKAMDDGPQIISAEQGKAVEELWSDPKVKALFEKSDEFYYLDAGPYHFDNVGRYCASGFVPSLEDCMMTRIRTTGIVVSEFKDADWTYKLCDVGGQRNERKKWLHAFDDVKALIWVCSLIDYNQLLFEDQKVNRMAEALKLFEDYINKDTFKDTPICVFLNKFDLFEAELVKAPITRAFPNYPGGPRDAKASVEWIISEFRGKCKNQEKAKAMTFSILSAKNSADIRTAWDTAAVPSIQKKQDQVKDIIWAAHVAE